ncbi:hypothetical protein NLU13_0273 [Sarocladium strictum]|uniref:Zn(2)-C6 fungal-type domain-containing protein n=1 Tax=Sarocladium strictum TaxID=5046 RepID=A0AA39LBA2_SARSR|nr:hypothetical protein NLU13_0273 [Sarocladium strictum]
MRSTKSMYVSRACDVCKRRKVKCDGVEPCANCNTSKLACSYNIQPRRRGRAVNKRPLDPKEDSNDPLSPLRPGSSPFSNKSRPTLSATTPSIPESPASAVSVAPPFPVIYGAYNAELDAIGICTSLLDCYDSLHSGQDIRDLAHHCIDLWMAFLYPVIPAGHEPTLRSAVSVFSRVSRPSALGPASALHRDSPQLAYMKSFALITAVCAYVCSAAPASLVPLKDACASPFLQASRAMLSSYEIYDLEEPDSTSLIIRTWHASAMQNTSGKHGAAAQTHMGAELLALRLRLYDEASVLKYTPHEAQQLRAIFWLLFHSDKASVAFSSRIYVLHEPSFDGDVTVQEYGDLSISPHLDVTRKFNNPSLDPYIHASFHNKRRMWLAAADLIKAVRYHPVIQITSPQSQAPSPATIRLGHGDIQQSELERLTAMYIKFRGSMEVRPLWTSLPEQPLRPDGTADPETTEYRERTCWALRSNVMTSFHCLRLIILQECCSRGLHSVMGLENSEPLLAVWKMDIVQEFLSELQLVPFECYKMQGEPGVQRIRQVGSRMLELVHNAPDEDIKMRAEAQCQQILDYLAKLDSKHSDELG